MPRVGHTCAGSCIHHHKALLASHFARLEAAGMHLLLDVHCQPSVTQSSMLSMLVYALQQGTKAARSRVAHCILLGDAGPHHGQNEGQHWNTSSEAVLLVSGYRLAATAHTPLHMQKGASPQAGCHGLLQHEEQQQQLAGRRHCFWAPPPAAAALRCLTQQMQAAAARPPPPRLTHVE